MSSAREDVLDRIRAALGRGRPTPEVCRELDRRISSPRAHGRPPVDDDLVSAFESRLTAVQGRLWRCTAAGVVNTIDACLEDHDLKRALIAAPDLRRLSWPSGWSVRFGASKGDDPVSVTPCFAAVAETGSVVLMSGAGSPTSLNFLPEFHIVLVYRNQIVRHVEDVWAKLRSAGEAPRSVNFITGPSKTADVEQTIQYGAHGPRSLDVVLVDGSNAT